MPAAIAVDDGGRFFVSRCVLYWSCLASDAPFACAQSHNLCFVLALCARVCFVCEQGVIRQEHVPSQQQFTEMKSDAAHKQAQLQLAATTADKLRDGTTGSKSYRPIVCSGFLFGRRGMV